MKELLENKAAEANHDLAVFMVELSKQGKTDRDAVLQKLEEALETKKEKQKEAEACLAQQTEETFRVKAALAQVDKDLENKRRHMGGGQVPSPGQADGGHLQDEGSIEPGTRGPG